MVVQPAEGLGDSDTSERCALVLEVLGLTECSRLSGLIGLSGFVEIFKAWFGFPLRSRSDSQREMG